jgi:REP element-mobilizing transposase RayT
MSQPLWSPRRFKSARNTAVYHCTSRTIFEAKPFNDDAKEMLRRHLHQVADFAGVQIITYALMPNRFSILVRVTEPDDASNEEILNRYKALYPSPTSVQQKYIDRLEGIFKTDGDDARRLRENMRSRMFDVSTFMSNLKHRFTRWFNQRNGRYGPLWSERFTSTIVDSEHFALQMVAAYIDLSPVRAGLVNDPKDYRFCGYAEAEAGDKAMIQGLKFALGANGQRLKSDEKILANYRLGLFGKGFEAATNKKTGGASEKEKANAKENELEKAAVAGGELSLIERIQQRGNYFSRGLAIGSKSFVEEHLERYRRTSNRRQHTAPRPFDEKGDSALSEIYTLRRRN